MFAGLAQLVALKIEEEHLLPSQTKVTVIGKLCTLGAGIWCSFLDILGHVDILRLQDMGVPLYFLLAHHRS